MSNSVWITVSRHEGDITLVEHKQAYRSINLPRTRSFQQSPTLIAFVGKKAKAAALKQIFADLNEAIPIEPHGQIRLLSDPRTREDGSPLVYVDCELHNQSPTDLRPQGHEGEETRRRLAWTDFLEAQPKAEQRASLGYRLYARVLAPFISVFCFFAADMGGLRGVSEAIAEQSAMILSPDFPQAALPRVLVVFPTASTAFDAEVWETKFVDMIVEVMIQYDPIAFRAREQALTHLYACFKTFVSSASFRIPLLLFASSVCRRDSSCKPAPLKQLELSIKDSSSSATSKHLPPRLWIFSSPMSRSHSSSPEPPVFLLLYPRNSQLTLPN